MISSSQSRLLGAMLVVVAGLATITSAGAQGFGPPQTIFGSISDTSGAVPNRLPVEAYIGDTLCGEGQTGYSGEGDARVTVYAVDVHEAGQTAGCGTVNGEVVRIKIGDRFAEQTTRWRAGPVQVDILFGSGATPVPIPTFTPVPPTAIPTSTSAATVPPATTEGATPTAGASGTGTPSPEVDSTSEAQTAATPSVTVALASTTPSATATLAGGVVSSVADSTGGGDDGDLPVWGIVVAVLAGVAVVGGGVGLVMARSRARDDDSMSPT
jgi:hypothetical protein